MEVPIPLPSMEHTRNVILSRVGFPDGRRFLELVAAASQWNRLVFPAICLRKHAGSQQDVKNKDRSQKAAGVSFRGVRMRFVSQRH